MTNKKKQEPDTRPLDVRLEEWLADSGYPLEMQVAEAFRRAAFNVFQAQYYLDAETGKAREFDVAALRSTGGLQTIEVKVVVECKRSPDKPWVLFTNKVHQTSILPFLRTAGSRAGRDFIRRARRDDIVKRLAHYQNPERIAYGMTQGFTNGEGVAYKATMSAANAALWSIKNHEEAVEPYEAIGLVVFPVIVVDAPLFEYYLDEDTAALNRISRGILNVTHPGGLRMMHLDVLTREACPDYASEISACVDAFGGATKALEGMEQLWEKRNAASRLPRGDSPPAQIVQVPAQNLE